MNKLDYENIANLFAGLELRLRLHCHDKLADQCGNISETWSDISTGEKMLDVAIIKDSIKLCREVSNCDIHCISSSFVGMIYNLNKAGF